MDVKFNNTFFDSLNRISNSKKWWRREFWVHAYYDLKWSLWAIKKYFKIVITMRPWDYRYILEMLSFQINTIKNYVEKEGHEVYENRMKRVKRMERVIELLHNVIEDDYMDRCGYQYTDHLKFKEVGNGLYELVNEDDDIAEKNEIAREKGIKLEKKEWNELFSILKSDLKGWWD